MECVAAWLPAATAWTVGVRAGPARAMAESSVQPAGTSAAAAALGHALRATLTTTLDRIPKHVVQDMVRLAPFLRKVILNCTRRSHAKEYLADMAPTLAAFLRPRAPHIVALVACARVPTQDLPIVVGEWLEGCAGVDVEGQKLTVALVVQLREYVSKTPTQLHRAMVVAHDALAARRSAAKVDGVLCDGGALLSINKAPPFMRAACAVLACVPHCVYTEDGKPQSVPLLQTCRNMVPDAVCPLTAAQAQDRVKGAFKTLEDHCALMERLPPRLVPPRTTSVLRAGVGAAAAASASASASAGPQQNADLWHTPTLPAPETDAEHAEEPAGGWTPEQLMSRALYDGDPTQPCARAVVIFTMRMRWASAFKSRGWVFGPEQRAALMRCEAQLRPLRPEHAADLVQWCAYADEVRWHANARAAHPCEARAADLREVVDSTCMDASA